MYHQCIIISSKSKCVCGDVTIEPVYRAAIPFLDNPFHGKYFTGLFSCEFELQYITTEHNIHLQDISFSADDELSLPNPSERFEELLSR